MDEKIGQTFIHRSRAYLTGDYLPKIRRSVELLPEEDVWWRPNEISNSVGNLLLHLEGNVRQWVVSGIGGAPDRRKREEEFDASGGSSGRALVESLERTLEEVDRVLSGLSSQALAETRVIQGMEVTILEAIYHVVEHFSTHTGQIIYLSKLRTGEDLEFWEVKDGKAVPRW